MTVDVPSGFLGNLNSEQQVKLQQLWTIILKAIDPDSPPEKNEGDKPSDSSPQQNGHSRTESNVSVQSAVSAIQAGSLEDLLKKMEMNAADIKLVQQALSAMTAEELREGILDTVKHENPDCLVLRFLRARKWDVAKACGMMMASISWRVKEMNVDHEVVAKGELNALRQSQNKSNSAAAKDGNDFLAQMRMGKCYTHGVDKSGRPIVVIRVQLHKPGAQSEETLNKFIVHVIENVRLMLVPPAETACVVFDMNGFGLSNMEYPPVKFIIKCFEANYPESLGFLLIHNAPWVFSGIWRLIRGWMDPVIVSKVHFTKDTNDLEKFIDRSQIVKELGGKEDWEYKYIEPNENENKMMEDTNTRNSLIAERRKLGEEMLRITAAWIAAAHAKETDTAAEYESQRNEMIEQLRVNYWKLDPYVRARNYLDREGVIGESGNINFYPAVGSDASNGVSDKVLEVQHLENKNGTNVVS